MGLQSYTTAIELLQKQFRKAITVQSC